MLKQFLHSEALSQAPVLTLPREVSNQLSRGDLRVSPTNDLGDRVCKEFLKTAAVVAQPPWNLLQASHTMSGSIRETV